MPVITEIADLKRIYERRVPRMFYDYCESGSWTEQTFRDNSSDFDDIRLRQRVAVDMSGRSTKSQMIGQDVAMPVALAPVGMTGMQHADGEIKAARAAEAFGVPFTLSTMSINSIEDVAEATTAPFWFQLYTMRDTDYVSRLIQRAKDAKCSALVITLDLQILGQRHKDLKNGLSAPPKLTPKTIANLATKWAWGLEMLGAKRREFGNIVGHVQGLSDTSQLSAWTAEQFDPTLDWNKVAKLKEEWGGKVILKGILDAEDAKMALKVGADAIVVSNHGGRQLDGALSSIRALPSILDAVGDQVEVHLDSGIRSGQDVLKAVAMGAKGTFIGRAFIYGLGAMGQKGVTTALEVIQREMDITMALCGETNVANLGRHNLLIPEDFAGRWQDGH
ncbi:alpha-hydroxy-acid oxidizing protein [Sulfitobacter pseudonitzschiae]|uniref:Alpha-hydroxy-acid oxidizing protein n=1 Tax=Pseudosulfitobacter pseudonitzschiae TaxID=1402135 RepID=A0A9Q2P0D4_9RHOB|nr:alpha-hydroxy acid oxidase [Pseudosulfitobacter pseudonitzschiae]MBM2292095.1 alpha-hydroxy-acid oxidizing protein [Pseudosulfitobacter pseudonitzschiae]MBM2297013.1 alpha-hydroxy-acid oxidizing protein [Pseudosulfitobacter pseudonitzschiae]MBM2301927.1 alpha-hydroxy-acid oxidizing protein [Pseudosulfitobacter pseudonitzschiae]MBM2311709.1 alpha-hydroxy-acid oxidizing protein [Pseudosulfitobacter pseudonitzschiae]MBM2316623.1 alpha-hydroxy-acid oxidizing protein [Pseudosulfitobacter pseudon